MRHLIHGLIILLFPIAVMAQTSPFYQSVKLHRCQIHKVMMAVSAPAVMAGSIMIGA